MILITGATGFLGRNLCEYLVRRGYLIRALVRSTSDTTFLRKLRVEIAVGDVTDLESVSAAMTECEQVIHAAAYFRLWGPSKLFEDTNVVGTQNVLKAAMKAKVQRFVHTSTIIAVGPQPPGITITEETPYSPYPTDHYARSKMRSELLALLFAKMGLPVIILRLGALYGPWGHYAFNRLFFEEFLHGWRVQVQHGQHIIFPCYVNDAVKAIEAALSRGQPGQVYNVSGQSMTHREINEIVSRLAGKSPCRINFPANVMINFARLLEFVARYTHQEPFYPLNLVPYVFEDWNVCNDRARRELGFDPTPFEQGARITLAWYRSVG